ncbi:MAG: hypothetical protein J6Y36_09010 [Treponema sp.]|uniref:hypothetical protein n=1 Tax=Treponema sp. TaxID=166 RepID=UPI001B6B85A5|nr:hypothetical protein [Treponema sp.]MBP5403282.1 hypothetical protein [Treponema sp.]MBR5932674.1 hypothetical protein [Treponema sp.]
MKKRLFLAVLTFCIVQFMTSAQSFDRISQILDSEAITMGQAAYLAGTYAKLVDERADEKAAFETLKGKGCFSDTDSFDTVITLKKLCSVFAVIVDFKGGFMYTVTKKSPRYSYKEFQARGFIPGSADPGMKVSGINAVALFNKITGSAK